MAENIMRILDSITQRVLAHRPAGKGLAAKRIAGQLGREQPDTSGKGSSSTKP